MSTIHANLLRQGVISASIKHIAKPLAGAGSELSPRDERLLTQQGGALVLRGTETVFRHDDSGILKHVSVKDLLAAAHKPVALPAPVR